MAQLLPSVQINRGVLLNTQTDSNLGNNQWKYLHDTDLCLIQEESDQGCMLCGKGIVSLP